MTFKKDNVVAEALEKAAWAALETAIGSAVSDLALVAEEGFDDLVALGYGRDHALSGIVEAISQWGDCVDLSTILPSAGDLAGDGEGEAERSTDEAANEAAEDAAI
jgi:hypothetical protein